jgi:hypothetical protein
LNKIETGVVDLTLAEEKMINNQTVQQTQNHMNNNTNQKTSTTLLQKFIQQTTSVGQQNTGYFASQSE